MPIPAKRTITPAEIRNFGRFGDAVEVPPLTDVQLRSYDRFKAACCAALAAAGVGLVALVPYWIAATGGGETTGTTAWNAFVHVLMVAGVFGLLLVPQLERWVDGHVMSG